MSRYIVIPAYQPDEYFVGTRVRVRDLHKLDGSPIDLAGRTGVVTAWARGTDADETFRETGEVDVLIDSEGPLVQWDEARTADWFPGQSMTLLEAL